MWRHPRLWLLVAAALVLAVVAHPGIPALALALHVFAVYGAIGGIAHVAAPASEAGNARRGWPKYPLALVALTAGAYLGTGCVALVADWLGGLPAPGPMSDGPLW